MKLAKFNFLHIALLGAVVQSIVKTNFTKFSSIPLIFILIFSNAGPTYGKETLSFIEIDKCVQLDIHKNSGMIGITALCDPDETEFLFNIWNGTNPIFFATKPWENGLPAEKETSHFKEFNLQQINFGQKSIRRKINYRSYPQIVAKAPFLVKELIKNFELRNSLDIFLSDGTYFSILEFQSDSFNEELASLSDKVDIQDQSPTKNLFLQIANKIRRVELREGYEFECKPNKESFVGINFLEVFKIVPNNQDCAASIILNPHVFLDEIAKHKKTSIENTIWAGLLYLDGRIGEQSFFNILSRLEKTEIASVFSFIFSESLALLPSKSESINKLVDLYSYFAIPMNAEFYSLLLHQNCSTYSEKSISLAQQTIKKLEQNLSIEDFLNGRIHFALSRNEWFTGIGYVDGPLGIIGKNSFDYCVNTVTLAKAIASKAISDEEKVSQLYQAFELLNATKLLSSAKTMKPHEYKLNGSEKSGSFDIYETFYLSLVAVNLAINGDYEKALEKWLQFLDLRYGIEADIQEYAPGEIEVLLTLISGVDPKKLTEKVNPNYLIKLSKEYFLGDVLYSSSSLTYLQRFEKFETQHTLFDKLITLLALAPQSKELQDTLFLMLQRRFVTPENASLNRRYRAPRTSKLSREIQSLLNERLGIIDSFYSELEKRNQEGMDELVFLKKLHESAKTTFPDYFSKGGVEEQILGRDSVVLPSEAQTDPGILDLMLFATVAQGWRVLTADEAEKIKKPNKKTGEMGEYNPRTTLQLYAKLKSLDDLIFESHPEFKDIFNNHPANYDEIKRFLADNEAVVFISSFENSDTIPAFYLTKNERKFVAHLKGTELISCIKTFVSSIQNLNYPSLDCQERLSAIFNPGNHIPLPNKPKLTFVVNGDLEKIPVGAIGLSFGKSEYKRRSSSNREGTRGFSSAREKEPSYNDTVPSTYMGQKYAINHKPSLNNIIIRGLLSKYKPDKGKGYLGIGVSEFELPNNVKVSQELNFLKELSNLPGALEEILQLSELFSNEAVTLLINEEVTKENLKTVSKTRWARILSFASHAIQIPDDNNENTALILSYNKGSNMDWVLTPNEIMELQLASDFVLLSACKTNVRSESLSSSKNSLVSSFLINGTTSVLASDWLVDDFATKELMQLLVSELKKESEPSMSSALKLAIQNMQKTTFHHPFYWSSFRVIGE